MSKPIQYLENNHAIEIIIVLSKSDKMYFSELKDKLETGGITTINSRLDALKEINIIEEETEEKTSKGKYVGVKRYIWLTPKGKHVAEKLVEIEEILEEK